MLKPVPQRKSLAIVLGAAAMALAAPPAQAQLLGGPLGGALPGLGGLPHGLPSEPPEERRVRGGLLGAAGETLTPAEAAVDRVAAGAQTVVGEVTRAAGARLIREHPDLLEADDQGRPVVRGRILALTPEPGALDRARAAGFRVFSTEAQPELGLATATLEVPRGVSAREAVARLRSLDPQGQYDFDHIYLPGGRATATGPAAAAPGAATARDLRIGLVDGSVDARARAFRGARIVQKAFGPGGARVSAHATAVASLMVGADGRFRGAAPGAGLVVADIYGPTPAGGSAEALVRGLAWLAQNRTPVIDVSLVGPPNLILGAAVKALVARGFLVVAAVGNDGPAAPPLYPASYPGVVAVTAVDARRRLLPEASRATHVDFAAPGAQMAAAAVDGGFVAVRGTSFAAPIAAGELARALPRPDPTAAARAVSEVARTAVDLGAPGPDPVFGRGLVGVEVRTDPASVGARNASIAGP